MANATPTRLGQNLATGDANALFLKIFQEKYYLLLVEKTK